jgi:ABC-type polysaccharide/polyol phosphate export permease
LEDIGRHRLSAVLEWSPIVAFLNLIRQPLLNHVPPTPGQYAYAMAVVASMLGLAAFLLGRLQKKLIFHL